MSVTGFSSPAANGVYGLPPPNITALARLAAAARDDPAAGGTDCAASEDGTLRNCAGQLTSGEETEASLCGGGQRSDCGGCDFCRGPYGACFEGDPETAEMRCQPGGFKACAADADCIDPAYDEVSQVHPASALFSCARNLKFTQV
jgi:hypothetical protein